jgi:ClpP class serine protease
MWLLEANTLNTILQAEKSGFNPSAEQLTAFRGESSEEGGSRIMSIAGETADISINGILTNTPSFMAMIFGGGNTTYSDIISAIASAEQNESIKNIVLSVDVSPGGTLDGLFGAVTAIAAAKKPVKAVVANMAASATFALISQADEVVALNEATRLGSVGIKFTTSVYEDEIEITSTAAPKKAPDVTTEEGKAVIRDSILDPMHEIFASSIAKGRGITTEKVNSDFGEGAIVLAGEAVKRGMIDSISGSIPQAAAPSTAASEAAPIAAESGGPAAPTNINATNGKNTREVIGMTKEELQAQHPATFAAVLAIGEASGVSKERDRVSAHLTMGEASGDMATAVKAIGEGSEMTAGLNATYMAAGMKKAELTARVGDNPDKLETAAAEADAKSAEDQVADAVCAALGHDEEVTA